MCFYQRSLSVLDYSIQFCIYEAKVGQNKVQGAFLMALIEELKELAIRYETPDPETLISLSICLDHLRGRERRKDSVCKDGANRYFIDLQVVKQSNIAMAELPQPVPFLDFNRRPLSTPSLIIPSNRLKSVHLFFIPSPSSPAVLGSPRLRFHNQLC